MLKTILFLYDDAAQALAPEDMFDRRDQLAAMLKDQTLTGGLDLDLAVAYATTPSQGPAQEKDGVKPHILVAHSPIFDEKGGIASAQFEEGDLEKYPVIIDHWKPNFRWKVDIGKGFYEETACGIGIPAERLVNYKTVQEYGNRKDRIHHDILMPHGVAIDTWQLRDIEAIPSNIRHGRFIVKPPSAARGKGIELFDNYEALLRARPTRSPGLLVQPFWDLKQKIPGLQALTDTHSLTLERLNQDGAAKEVRMHVFVTTDEQGERHIEMYPLLRVGVSGAAIMKDWTYIPLNPSSLPHDDFIYKKSEAVAYTLSERAGVLHYYGAIDWAYGRAPGSDATEWVVCEFNCRGPRLWEGASLARTAFIRMISTMARQALLVDD